MLSSLLKVIVACNWIITDVGVSIQPSTSLFIHSHSLWSCRNQMCLQSHSLVCFSHFLNGYTSFRSCNWEIEFFGVRVCRSLHLHTEFPKVLPFCSGYCSFNETQSAWFSEMKYHRSPEILWWFQELTKFSDPTLLTFMVNHNTAKLTMGSSISKISCSFIMQSAFLRG